MDQIDGLVQERCNSSVLTMELCLSRTNPSRWYPDNIIQNDWWNVKMLQNIVALLSAKDVDQIRLVTLIS